MQIPEYELENILFHEMFQTETLQKRTGFIHTDFLKHFRQVNLGEYGIVDLLTIDIQKGYPDYSNERNRLKINIIELKSGVINSDAYLQAIRYAAGIHHFFSNFINTRHTEIYVTITMIGHDVSIPKKRFFPIRSFINAVDIYTYQTRPYFWLTRQENYLMLEEEVQWGKGRGNQVFYNLLISSYKSIIHNYKCRTHDIDKRMAEFWSSRKNKNNG